MALEIILNMICFKVTESDIIDQVESSIHDLSIDGMFHCTFGVEVTSQRQRQIFILLVSCFKVYPTLLHSEYLTFLYGDE